MGHWENKPFAIPQIRSFIPEKVKPWLVIIGVLIVQLSGGVYLGAINEIVGSTQLLREDIMMAGQASLIGMAIYFTLMFRLKSAVRPKTTLSACLLVMITVNIACIYVTNVPLLVGLCLVGGFFRMWATFEFNSTIQLWLTPKRDMSVFFCYIYLVVNGIINLSGIMTSGIAEWVSWHYVHWAMTILLLLLYLFVLVAYKGIAIMPRMPLLGVDWIGMVMWVGVAMTALFVCVYGEHYDWWSSEHIRVATLLGVVLLLMNLLRASFIRHPYYMLRTFTFSILPLTVMVIVLADILLAPSHIFEHALMADVLGYDELHVASLNWVGVAGTVAGILFTWLCFARRKWTYQHMLVIGFSLFALYLLYFYFMIDYNLPKGALVLPIFIRSAGYVMVAVAMLTAITRMPFPSHFTQGISIHNMFSAVLAGAIGTAVVGRLMKVVMTERVSVLSEGLDRVALGGVRNVDMVFADVYKQAMLESVKEINGWLLLLAIVCLIGLCLRHSAIHPKKVIHPTFRVIYNLYRREIKARIRQRRMARS